MDEGQEMFDVGTGGPLPLGRHSALRPRSRVSALLMALMAVLMISPLVFSTASAAPVPAQTEPEAAAQASEWSAPRTVYIPDTGHTIDGVFLDYWRAAGGANAYGNPITAEFMMDGHIVQYYEYARFEYVPEDPEGTIVHLGSIGEDLRPQMVMRQVGNGAPSAALAEMARISRAWLPVSDDLASKQATDSWVYVPETGHTVAHGFKSLWEYIGVGYLGNPLTEEYIIGGETRQVFERGLLIWTQESGAYLAPVGLELAERQRAPMDPVYQGDIPTYDEALFIAPEPEEPEITADGGEIWIDVNLSAQYMTVYQGSTELLSSYVSTGRPEFATPPGTFYINTKLESQTMEGVLGGEYYNVPDVPYVMYFTDVGHAIHGAYWHSNFGAVMSHGCINLPLDVAAWLYGVAGVGTRLEIHY
jgi:lipoprotein-anchoring transpeptidase ErfK/SrfK